MFAHATNTLPVAKEYLALGGGPPEFTPGFTGLALLGMTPEGTDLSPTGLSPTMEGLSRPLRLDRFFVTSPLICISEMVLPRPRHNITCRFTKCRFRLVPFRSPLLRKSRFLSFPGVTKMFQFTPFPSVPYFIQARISRLQREGFPHSEIPGSKLA